MSKFAVPLICFAVGLVILLLAIPGYGRALFQDLPEYVRRRDVVIYLVGYSLVALALMLGFIGYLGFLDAVVLHYTRPVIGIIGLIMLFYQYLETVSRP